MRGVHRSLRGRERDGAHAWTVRADAIGIVHVFAKRDARRTRCDHAMPAAPMVADASPHGAQQSGTAMRVHVS